MVAGVWFPHVGEDVIVVRILALTGAVLVAGAITVSGCSPWRGGEARTEILFVRDNRGGPTILLLDVDSGETRRMVSGDEPEWSPDGTHFAYRTADDGAPRCLGTSIWVMDAELGAKRRVAASEDPALGAFAWAPDGVRLAYVEYLSRVRVVNTVTGESELVSLDVQSDGPLQWSTDGRRLLVATYASATVLDLDRRTERPLIPRPRLFTMEPSWSPDEERLAFGLWNTPWNPRRQAFDPPSGRLQSSIVVANGRGRAREHLTDDAFDNQPVWSPDGSRIYFTRGAFQRVCQKPSGGTIYELDLASHALRQLTDGRIRARSPHARPSMVKLPDPPAAPAGEIVVPNLVDRHLYAADVRRILREAGLGARFVLYAPKPPWIGVVREQVPAPGTLVPRGTIVEFDMTDLASLYLGERLSERFSSAKWKAHAGCAPANPRASMTFDLMDRILKRGMARERVLSLLGDPARAASTWSAWPIGARSLVRVDCIYLRVEFDRAGKVADVLQWVVP